MSEVAVKPGAGKAGSLFDLKVLDLGHYIAGPYCASLLAGLGAEVIKVEKPGTGDGARRLGPFAGDQPHAEKSGLFSYLNLGKKGLTLNLKSETGREVLRQLVVRSDVLVENFAPRVMPSLGLDYETLRKINPSLVMVSISNYGQTGPYRDYKGYEATMNALSGIQWEIGEPDREPLKLGGQQMQFQAGLVGAIATLSAICYRDVTGIGQHIDLAIVEIAATMKGAPIAYYQYAGYERVRNGSRPLREQRLKGNPPPDPREPSVYPIAILRCKDGDVCIDTELGPQWAALCEMIGRPELKEDRAFSYRGRCQNAEAVDEILMEWLKDKTQQEVFDEASTWRIPVGIVNNTAQLFHDPQHRARNFFVPVDHPILGQMEYPGHPFVMSKTPWQVSSAPLLGQHNREILVGRLGYADEQVAEMVRGAMI